MKNASEIHQKMCRKYWAQKVFSRWDSRGGMEALVTGKTHYCVIVHEVRRTLYRLQTGNVVICDYGRTKFCTNCRSCFIILLISWKTLWKFFHIEKIDFLKSPSNPNYKNKFAPRKKYRNWFWLIVDKNMVFWKFRHLILKLKCGFESGFWLGPHPKSTIYLSAMSKNRFQYFLRGANLFL